MKIVEEEDEHKFDFDLLEATKTIPEELVSLKMTGKLTLNRNPDNFFAETEQVAFCPEQIVPGLDFSNDPLMQGRLFSYTDRRSAVSAGQTSTRFRLIIRSRPRTTGQRDAIHRMTIDKGQAFYEPNSIDGG